MRVVIGEKGRALSWQEEFPKNVKCHKCGKKARIAFVAFETEEEHELKLPYVCDLHKNGKGGMWFHDATSVAVYACSSCLEVTALANQA